MTSAAETSQGRLGLGYLRRAHWREGERLTTPAGDAVVRRVVVHEPGVGDPRLAPVTSSRSGRTPPPSTGRWRRRR